MTARDGHGRSTLTTALASKGKDMFEAVLTSLEEDLTKDEVGMSGTILLANTGSVRFFSSHT